MVSKSVCAPNVDYPVLAEYPDQPFKSVACYDVMEHIEGAEPSDVYKIVSDPRTVLKVHPFTVRVEIERRATFTDDDSVACDEEMTVSVTEAVRLLPEVDFSSSHTPMCLQRLYFWLAACASFNQSFSYTAQYFHSKNRIEIHANAGAGVILDHVIVCKPHESGKGTLLCDFVKLSTYSFMHRWVLQKAHMAHTQMFKGYKALFGNCSGLPEPCTQQ